MSTFEEKQETESDSSIHVSDNESTIVVVLPDAMALLPLLPLLMNQKLGRKMIMIHI